MAERILKVTENISGQVAIPAINELRYAGFHVLKGLSATDPEITEKELFKAKDHCERAAYDAAAAGLVVVAESIRVFQLQYRDIVISDVVNNIADIRARVDEAEKILADGESSAEQLDVEKIVSLLDSLRSDVTTLDQHAPDLQAKLRERTMATKRFIFMLIATVAVAPVVAVILSHLLK